MNHRRLSERERRGIQRLRDPDWFVRRMKIRDKAGKLRPFGTPRLEQQQVIDAWRTSNRILVLKSRQLGITTVVCALYLHQMLFSRDQFNQVTVCHEGDATERVNSMYQTYIANLPKVLRPNLSRCNTEVLQAAHNDSLFKQTMAGGRSQGRSFTYQGFHATEVGFWPRGSSARSGKSVDEDAWASIMATIEESDRTRIVVESTADGPSGVFHQLVLTARESEAWSFLFFPWFDFLKYRRQPPPGWERTQEEHRMALLYDLDDAQLAFRRFKIVDENYGLERFRKEYPSTWEEPFLITGGMWFNVERLNIALAALGRDADQRKKRMGLQIFREFEPHRRYFIGGDPSGGTGGDQAVWVVLRDDYEMVAIYADRNTPPTPFAELGLKLSIRYGGGSKCPILCEENNHGRAVNSWLEQHGANLWRNDEGKLWWTDNQTGVMSYDYAKTLIDGGFVRINDAGTLGELMTIKEKKNGKIEADEGYNDDRADALVLALWCARRSARAATPEESIDAAIMRARERRLQGSWG